MKALLWIFAFLVLCAAVLCIRLRVFAEYGESGAALRVSLGFFALKLPQSQDKAGNRHHAGKKPLQKMDAKEEKRPGPAENYRKLLPIIGELLGKLRARLTVDELTFRYLSAGDDPARAAFQFGAVNAAAGLLMNPLDSMFRIKKRDVQTAISFTEKKPQVYAALRVSIRLGQLLWLGIWFWKLSRSRQNKMKSPDTEV